MIKTRLLTLAACLAAFSASANDDLCRYTGNCDYEIREKLLGTPVWIFELTRAQRNVLTGEVRFEQRGYKLVAVVDVGWKCEAEVEFVEGGFMVGCNDPRKYTAVVDTYQSINGSYIHTLRPRN